jgi:glutathione S-transferase
MLKLFTAPGTCALASHIALIDAGAKHEIVRINFRTEDQRKPEYLAINPKARVPALITERGVLTETPAILVYIAQSFPAAKLAPMADPYVFAEAQAFNSYLCSTLHINHAHRMRGTRWVEPNETEAIAAMQRKVTQNITDCFSLIETTMLKGPWVLGADYSVCDAYLFTVSQWMEGDSVDPKQFPKVYDHMQRMAERASVQQALSATAPPRG